MNFTGALLSAVIGCISWILFAFAGQPIRRFWDIRGEVAHASNKYARFISEPPSSAEKLWLSTRDDRNDAQAEFKRLGLALITFAENENLASLVLSGMGFRLTACGKLLLQMSEALGSGASLGPRRSEILGLLRLAP